MKIGQKVHWSNGLYEGDFIVLGFWGIMSAKNEIKEIKKFVRQHGNNIQSLREYKTLSSIRYKRDNRYVRTYQIGDEKGLRFVPKKECKKI